MRRYVVLLAVMALLMVALAVPAFAQGQVERGPEHTRSICAYSGLNDEPDDPVEGPDAVLRAGGQEGLHRAE